MKTIRSLIIFHRYFNVQTWYLKRGNSFLKPVSMTFKLPLGHLSISEFFNEKLIRNTFEIRGERRFFKNKVQFVDFRMKWIDL